MAAVGQQSGNCLPPSETTKFSIWPTRRCRQKLARNVQTCKLQAAYASISLLETHLAKAREDTSSWQNKYEKLQEHVATTAAPTNVQCDREELVTRLSLEVPSLVDGILGESTVTNEQTAKRNMAAHCFGVTAMQIKDMSMAALNRVQRDPTLRKPMRNVRAVGRAHRRPPVRRSAAEAVPATGWSVAGRHGRRCKTQLSRERCCYSQVMAGAGGKAKEVGTLTGAAWFKMNCCEDEVQRDVKENEQQEMDEDFDEDFYDCEKLPEVEVDEMLRDLELQDDGQAHHDDEAEVEHADDDDDEKALREYAELAQEEKLQEQAKYGPALALLQRVQSTKQVPCGCGELLVASTLTDVGVTGAARSTVCCDLCKAKLGNVMALAICHQCYFGLCSVCLLRYRGRRFENLPEGEGMKETSEEVGLLGLGIPGSS